MTLRASFASSTSRHPTIPVFIPASSTLPIPEIPSKGISSVYNLILAVWNQQHLIPKDVEVTQLSLRLLVKYLQIYALKLRLTTHR